MLNSNVLIFSGRANPKLALDVCNYLNQPLGKMEIEDFSDGEIFVQIGENVRGQDVFVIQPTCQPNNNLVELLIIIDALKRASAERITAVMPYYGYARQDRKVQPRVPITAKLMADLISAAGTDRVLTIDLHAGQIQGFFNIPVDHLFATPVFLESLENIKCDSKIPLVVVAPDSGGVPRARAYAKILDLPIVLIDKRREEKNQAKVMNIIGEVAGKCALVPEDMFDTFSTLKEVSAALIEKGATDVIAFATHGVFSGPAIERISQSMVSRVVVTDTIPLSADAQACKKIQVLSVNKLIGKAIRSIHFNASVSDLFVAKN